MARSALIILIVLLSSAFQCGGRGRPRPRPTPQPTAQPSVSPTPHPTATPQTTPSPAASPPPVAWTQPTPYPVTPPDLAPYLHKQGGRRIAVAVKEGEDLGAAVNKDGRLIMARTLEEMWPGIVSTKWRFGRPQHVIKNNWKDFKHPLIRRPDLDWEQIKQTDYGLRLVNVSPHNNEKVMKSNAV